MPASGKDKPWYSIEQASVHFTIISTEHNWTQGSEQYEWIKSDLGSIDRARTPWLIFTGHRPIYSSNSGGFLPSVDPDFVKSIEPLLLDNKVDLVLVGHVHNYERTCAVFDNECKGMPKKDKDGIDTYDNRNYSAPVYAVIGMAGFKLDNFSDQGSNAWSLSRYAEFGYVRVHATKEDLRVEFVNSTTREVRDSFRITKGHI
ncbi:putative inactive purple acid phosphatase 27 [Acorus gramineus]|uniref:Inactive purple acid phosphatase 27 n=1 Tax=Acorus gramineus TaxID=55184 RepID=A0AAV8ZYI6_ACOGR|nr:putative inactive purple acid phosphatase 27 [Acorus gramineus]